MGLFRAGAALALTAALALGCSSGNEGGGDGPAPADAGYTDGAAPFPDGYVPFPCSTPGQSCNAHNACAIDPVCGPDKLCRPRGWMDCNDELACTVDTCAKLGQCLHTPRPGTCLLPVRVPVTDGGVGDAGPDAAPATKTVQRCFTAGDKKPGDPCQICQPPDDAGIGGSATKWSGANGGACDDGNACTKDDYCNAGTCKGTYYGSQCADQYGCTDDLCDGKGGCLGNKLKTGWCLINGVCYKDGANHPGGTCFTCDPSKSPSSWTPISNTCMIGGACYKKGDKNPAGCGECDPGTSTTDWTVVGTTCCLIGGVGYKAGVKDSTGCSICDPTKSKTAWTLLSNVCKIGGKCYQKGDKNPAGCGACDPATNQSDWTVTGTTCCWIGGKSYNSGDKDAAGCATCDPATDPYTWTPIPNTCKIDGLCYKPNDVHPGGCAACKPATSQTSWTVTKSGWCVAGGQCYPLCNGKCIDLGTDPNNCGVCGKKCGSGLVCKKGTCTVPCTMVADFESGAWSSIWTLKSGSAGTISATYAHDGKYGVYNPGWHYETSAQTGAVGDKLTAWTRFGSSKGRTYLGFAASSSGCQSCVFAPNTSNLMFQKNSSYGYSDLTKISFSTFKANNWYLMEIEFLSGGKVTCTVYDSDGKTKVASVSHTFSGSLAGGVAIRSFGSHAVDTIQFCK